MYRAFSIKGKRYRINTEKAKGAAIGAGVILGMILEALWLVGWCNYWF